MQFRMTLLGAALMGMALAAPAHAALDIVDATTGTVLPNYFAPSGAATYASPYYRNQNQDWGWTHAAIAGPVTQAVLSISAFDVDFAQGEIDRIEAYDAATSTWLVLGNLAGANDIYAFTDFTLSSDLFDDVIAGLQVRMNIDVNNAGWLVTLAKSTLCTDNVCEVVDPNPGTSVPEPATLGLFGLGLAGLVAARRRRKA